MSRGLRVVLSVLAGVVLAATIAWVQTAPGRQNAGATGVAGAAIGGDFAGLTDQNGQTLSADAFEGRAQLVFFGFTHCPAICPTELTRMTYVLKRLSAAERARLAPVFVTVDPARDTPELLKVYMDLFDPSITAVTGDPARLEQVRRDWKVYAARVETPELNDYTMDHSAFLYLRGADGRLIDLFDAHESPDAVLAAVKAAVSR